MRPSSLLLCGSAAAIWLAAGAALADDIELRHNYTGTVDYLFTGQPLADNTNQVNGVDCLQPNGILTVNANMLPAGANLLSAQLYVAGSLIGNDGLDYPPSEEIFPAPAGSSAEDAADIPTLNALARQWATVQVAFTPPGAAKPVMVSTADSNAYVSVYYIGSGSEAGNVGFFSTPIDVTAAIAQAGGNIAGTYNVGDVVADVCNGQEAVCGITTCGQVSAVHSNGTASFALLLIFEDPSLPMRTVSVFEGLDNLFANSVAVQLMNGSPVSNPASGTLTYFVLEGDLSISGADLGTTCGGQEYVTVGSVPPGPTPSLCLNDNDNPPGNIFNGSINTLPAGPNPPAGCTGPHLCGLAGVDIDRYDISAALEPGADEIDVTISTGSDRVGAAVLVLGVDVYAPLLQADSQFHIFGDVGTDAHVGSTLTYALALSNTGNLDATDVSASIPMPTGVYDVQLIDAPSGAQVDFEPQGGPYQTGNFNVTGVTVEVGKVAEVRFSLVTNCSLDGNNLEVGATVNGNQLVTFDVQAPVVSVAGPGVQACLGVDPDGALARLDPVPALSGGGCNTGVQSAWSAMLAAWMLLLRRRRKALATFASLVLVALPGWNCGARHSPQSAASEALQSTAHLPGTACAQKLMAQVTDANGNVFCIDRFEADTAGGSLGNAQQSSDDTSTTGDGSTTAQAAVALGVKPAAGVSWYQAQAACGNAQKRLCTVAEWELACRGAAADAYPYGNTYDADVCNGYEQFSAQNPAPTGDFAGCVSAAGLYDLSGNVEEWLADAVVRTPGTTALVDRAVHGGSYASNFSGLVCAGSQFHAAPSTTAPDRGFRCCADAAD